MTEDLAEHSEEPMTTARKGIALVWLIPLLAALIGAWMVWKDWSDRGPLVHIEFKDVEGLEAGKSKIRYRSLEMGTITAFHLAPDQQSVIVTAELNKEAESFLSKNTRFWVVKPQVGLGRITGLETLLSGSYIGMDFNAGESDDTRDFLGLESQPPVSVDTPGSTYRLFAERQGAVSIGSPVTYRNIQAGFVTAVELDRENRQVAFSIFVHEPYDQLVTSNSVFWNVGGFNLELGSDGLHFDMESLDALVRGGIAFGLPKGVGPKEAASVNQRFYLFDSEKEARKRASRNVKTYMVYFTDPVPGLKVGAPVELYGFEVGEVIHIDLEFNPNTLEFNIPVVIKVDRDAIRLVGEPVQSEHDIIHALVAKGLRARLKSGSLLTGAQVVELTILPEEELKPLPQIAHASPLPVIPSIPSSLTELEHRVNQLFTRLEKLPIDSIAANLDASLKELKVAVTSLNQVLEPFGKRSEAISSSVDSALKRLDHAMRGVSKTVAPQSATQLQLRQTLADLSASAKAIRDLARFLERNPQSLLLGK
jgi:paraquat-inducible protein B